MVGGWVYIVASKPYGTLYLGVTSNLVHRIWQHREHVLPGFTAKYGCTRLVWYERHDDIRVAIQREKTMKHWARRWKIDLIAAFNPHWHDLWDDIADPIDGRNEW